MSDANNLVYICVHCGQVVENKDSEWHDRQCLAKNVNMDEDQEDIELNVDEVEEETPEAKQIDKNDYALRLINAVRARGKLWDKYEKRDIPGRQKAWDEIDSLLGCQPGNARRDWNHVRDKFRGEKKFLSNAMEAGRPVAPRWEYYNHLTFLNQDKEPAPIVLPPPKPPAVKVISSKIVTVNGKKGAQLTRPRKKPGPKPGSRRKKQPFVPPKPIERPKRVLKPTHSKEISTINSPSSTARLNELRVVVSRNEYADLTNRKNLNSINVMNDSNSRKRPVQSEMESTSMKQVCIRNPESQSNNTPDYDTAGKFCSYLEVMLRTLPKEKQEVFYEETLDHLATLKRQLRRSNHSNPSSNYM